MVICLEQGADLHMAQLMPLPLTVSCFSKIQIGFAFLVPAHPGSPGKGAVKRVCVCVINERYYFSSRQHRAAFYYFAVARLLYLTQVLGLVTSTLCLFERDLMENGCMNPLIIISIRMKQVPSTRVLTFCHAKWAIADQALRFAHGGIASSGVCSRIMCLFCCVSVVCFSASAIVK